MANSITFTFLFLIQLSFGFPFLSLFLFWHAATSSWYEVAFWSFLAGIAFTVTHGNPWYWIGIMAGSAFTIFLIRIWVVRALTLPLFSLLLLFAILFWYNADIGMIKEIGAFYFLSSALLFPFYVFFIEKKIHIQRKLF